MEIEQVERVLEANFYHCVDCLEESKEAWVARVATEIVYGH